MPGCVPTYTKAKTKWLSRNFALVGGATLHGHGWDRSLPPRRVPSLKETRFCGRRGDPFQPVPIHDQIVPHAAVRRHPMNSSAIALCQPSMRVQLHQLPRVIDLHHQLAFCQCIPIPHHLQCAAMMVVRIYRPSDRITCRRLLLHAAHVWTKKKTNGLPCTSHTSTSPPVWTNYMRPCAMNSMNSYAHCVLRIHRPPARITCSCLLLHAAHAWTKKNNQFSCTQLRLCRWNNCFEPTKVARMERWAVPCVDCTGEAFWCSVAARSSGAVLHE